MESDEELFPWDQGNKKKNKGIGHLPEKTNPSCKVRSKPKVEGQEHLEIYLMLKEKERLENLGQVAEKMRQQTARSWRQVQKEIAQAKKKVSSPQESGVKAKGKVENSQKQMPKNPMQTIALDY